MCGRFVSKTGATIQALGGPGEDRLFGKAGTDQLDGELDFDRCNGGSPARGDTAANCEQVSNVP